MPASADFPVHAPPSPPRYRAAGVSVAQDCRLLGLRAAIGGMPVWTRGGQRETWPVRLPPEQHLRIGDKLPTAAVNKVRGNDRVRRIAPAQRVLIRPGRPVGEGGVSSTSQLPARSVPLRAAMAATSNPRRASKKACITSPPQQRFQRAGRHAGRRTRLGANPQAIAAEPLRSACACCSVQLSSPLSTSRRRIPSRAICAVRLSSASIMGDDYSALPKVLHCAGSPLSKPRLNQV